MSSAIVLNTVDPYATPKKVLTYAVMLILAYIFIFPLLFMFSSALKPQAQIFEDLYSIAAVLPTGDISLDNYVSVFESSRIGLYFFNSFFITTTTVVLSLLVNSMLAYSLVRLEWKGRGFILTFIIALMIIPLDGIAIPLLMLVSHLPWIGWDSGLVLETTWLNTYHVQILPLIANPFFIFLFVSFFKDIPKEFDEAAAIDGATPFQIYWRIILPMSKPVIATVAILQFLGGWNQYLFPVLFTQSEGVRPVMLGIQQFFGNNTEWGEVMAYASLITLPVLLVFLIFQRQFVQSMAGAGIKG
ncbi:carbohydrate ABC transporter permease [Alginatibacterium sediminis]|uniref:sn-glycerol-3-phosphate transport system permease protein UgpE n=1 Tax=Alginatibacterium sediminis TaxID=2164068 RepID=A0A420EBE7_9ALTE|nr:carbohydrate ABC transporter permease [Alginatibacterium sediminis]RKF17962.1 carbohydrate ABC transporter permease [Alginatibacterium sediminis]